MAKNPGSYGLGAPSNDTDAIAIFIWGAGGQIATESNGKWTAQLTSPAAEAGIKVYADLYQTYHLSPAKYVGQTELGNIGATSDGANEDFALGKLDLYIDGPWASANFPANAVGKSDWASFPIPSQNGPNPAPAFAGGSDLGIWATSKYKPAAWNEFVFALTFLGTDTVKYTLPIYVQYFYGRGSVDWGGIMAASTLFTVPVMICFLIVQRRMAGGLMAGAVKG
jgi:N,N'-diacetylchitobiose transport system substrate-binding protein